MDPNHPEVTRVLAAEHIVALTASARRARGASGAQRGQLPDRRGADGPSWIPVGLAVAAVAWGANQFSPLLLVYRQRQHLSATLVDATFGLYAAGLIPALLIGGHLGDRHGRRQVLLSALAVSFPATLSLIAGGDSLPMLFTGRLLSGIASGLAFGSGAAWIKELSVTAGSV